jgi:hypothetical protein
MVITHGLHGRAPPLLFAAATIQDVGCDKVVPIGEDIRFHGHDIPHNALCRKRAAVDLRPNSFHDDANLSI